MNFFEKELRGLLGSRPTFKGATFVGRACIAPLGDGVLLKVEFSTTDTHGRYDALKLSVINAKEGTVDKLTLYHADYMPKVVVGSGPLSTVPYIREDGDRTAWYPRAHNSAALKPLTDAVCEYAKAFK